MARDVSTWAQQQQGVKWIDRPAHDYEYYPGMTYSDIEPGSIVRVPYDTPGYPGGYDVQYQGRTPVETINTRAPGERPTFHQIGGQPILGERVANPTPGNIARADAIRAQQRENQIRADWQQQVDDMMALIASQQEEYYRAMEAYQAEVMRQQQMAELEGLWGQRSAAENQAITDIDAMISENRSHAAMTGQDYSVSEEQRDMMVSNLFADYFPAEVEGNIQDLIGTLGVGSKFKGVARGQEGTFEALKGSIAELNRLKEQGTGGSQVVLTGEDEDALEQADILG